MSKATREAAIAKLDKVQPMIGYPDKWRDYSDLSVTKDRLVTSIRAANVFESRRQLAKLGTPVDRGEWGMTPQTVNAYYTAGMNMIVFPAGILQPPFFDPEADPAVNYGGIGAMIGHELGHGFDDQGVPTVHHADPSLPVTIRSASRDCPGCFGFTSHSRYRMRFPEPSFSGSCPSRFCQVRPP